MGRDAARTRALGVTPSAAGDDPRFRLLDAAPDAAVVIDASGKIVLVNEQTEHLFQYDRHELLGQPVELLLPERFRRVHVGHRSRYLDDPHRRPMGAGLDLAGRRKDGTEFPVDVSLSAIVTDQDGLLAMAFIRDITDRQAAAEALARANESLERRAEELERRNDEIVLVSEMGNLLQSCDSSDEAYDIIARFAQRLFADVAGAILVRKTGNLLETVASWRLSQAHRVFAANDCWALRRGTAHEWAPTALRPRCAHVDERAGEYLCVPMTAQGHSLGVVHLERPSDISSEPAAAQARWEATCSLAGAMAEHVGLALANYDLRETLRHQSIRDPLTNLFNRRFLHEYMERELRRATRIRSPLAIVMADLDHFKEFNDEYGHAVGDAALEGLAELLRSHLRGADVACRYGGEEFTIILPDCAVDEAARRADEVRRAVKTLAIAGAERAITLSLGVAAFPAHGDSAEALLRAADAALYAAKLNGRDSVAIEPLRDERRTRDPQPAS